MKTKTISFEEIAHSFSFKDTGTLAQSLVSKLMEWRSERKGLEIIWFHNQWDRKGSILIAAKEITEAEFKVFKPTYSLFRCYLLGYVWQIALEAQQVNESEIFENIIRLSA